ncbi:MAG: stage III sporulation protein AA [Clostridiales bacterium GWB2_37_7]|nr:MAG: stage III sporulation protein AA [Clostridiales bacterium GWB2_37_7]
MNNYKIYEVLKFMPKDINEMIEKLPALILDSIEEIRLRLGKPLILYGGGKEYLLDKNGRLVFDEKNAYICSIADIKNAVSLVTNFSMYSFEDDIRNGFVTIDGGHRVGICGKVVLENGKVRTMRDISFVNYRVARQVLGAADKVLNYILSSDHSIYNTLIISPPQCGKTTILRDLIRQISSGIPAMGYKGRKIGLIDERNEIAACSLGLPKNDVGIRTDVLDGCPKAEGIQIMIRSMSPEIIATDEIGRSEDAGAVLDAINAGVKIITTIHGSDIGDFLRKPALDNLHKYLFERYIIMSRRLGVGTIEAVLDADYKALKNTLTKEKLQ